MAIAAGLFLGSFAKADSVTFNTTGTFSGPNLSSGDLVFSNLVGSGTSTLSFTGVTAGTSPQPYDVPPLTNIDLGSFTLTISPTVAFATFQSGNTFSLTLDQVTPTVGTGVQTSTTIYGSVVGGSGSTVGILFNTPNVFYIDSEAYTVNNFGLSVLAPGGSGPLTGTLTATAAAISTPLPLPLAGGCALLGVVAVSKRRRTDEIACV
jgi:hypothetical protein